jgi:hypothetical protein
MPTLFLLFNHQFTPAQHQAAREELGVRQVVSLPPRLQDLWGQMPPEVPALRDYLEPVRVWLAAAARPGDYVLVQGDFGATYLMVGWAREQGFIPVYATTSREAVEEHRPDGSVKMVHYFQHQRFRRYGE